MSFNNFQNISPALFSSVRQHDGDRCQDLGGRSPLRPRPDHGEDGGVAGAAGGHVLLAAAGEGRNAKLDRHMLVLSFLA